MGGGGEDAKKWTHVGGGWGCKKWNQIQEFEIIFIGLLLVHNPQKTDLNECNWMSQCLNVKPKRVWACRLHSKKQLSWNILIGKDSKGDFRHMSGKPVGRVWAWFLLASKTKLGLSNQSTFHWKNISDERWERPLLLCGYIKKKLDNASWHMGGGGVRMQKMNICGGGGWGCKKMKSNTRIWNYIYRIAASAQSAKNRFEWM